MCKSNQRFQVAQKQIRLPENKQNTYHYRTNVAKTIRSVTGDSTFTGEQ